MNYTTLMQTFSRVNSRWKLNCGSVSGLEPKPNILCMWEMLQIFGPCKLTFITGAQLLRYINTMWFTCIHNTWKIDISSWYKINLNYQGTILEIAENLLRKAECLWLSLPSRELRTSFRIGPSLSCSYVWVSAKVLFQCWVLHTFFVVPKSDSKSGSPDACRTNSRNFKLIYKVQLISNLFNRGQVSY